MVKTTMLKDKKGDTIIEVMIAILVVGTILGSAYVSANRYYKNIRQAQEYSTAMKIAEGQIEQIKSLIAGGNAAPFTQSSPFCLMNGTFQAAIDPANCRTADAVPYAISVSRTGDSTTGYTFVASVSWANINGGTDSTLNLRYRIFQR